MAEVKFAPAASTIHGLAYQRGFAGEAALISTMTGACQPQTVGLRSS